MKVQELLINIRNKEFKMERELQVKKYLPIEVKKAIANAIISECIHEENGVLVVDSVQQYLSYVKYMIKHHTNLVYGEADYDVLCSTDCGDKTLLNTVLGLFEPDAKECLRIMNLMISDYMQQNSIEFAIGRFLNSLSEQANALGGELKGLVDNLGLNLENVDKDSFNKFLTTYMK